MSTSAHRAERRRAERAHAKRRRMHDEHCGVLFGWCATKDDLPDARRQTHDLLIKLMGARRTGPVSWVWWTGDEAHQALDRAAEGELRTEHLANYRQLRAHLREWGGYIVLATAPGTQP